MSDMGVPHADNALSMLNPERQAYDIFIVYLLTLVERLSKRFKRYDYEMPPWLAETIQETFIAHTMLSFDMSLIGV